MWTCGQLVVQCETGDGPVETRLAIEVGLTDNPAQVAAPDQTLAKTMLATAARVTAQDGVASGDQTLITRAQTMATQLGGAVGTTLLADLTALGSGDVNQQRSARTRLVLPEDGLDQLGS